MSDMIRSVIPDDAGQIAAIYNRYVENTVVSFEEQAVSASQMKVRVARGLSPGPWLVAESDGEILGFAYASPWNPRHAYRLTVETTIYVAPEHVRHGVGAALYGALIDRLRARALHCANGVIALPNPPSVALHEKLGYVKIGELCEVGRKFGRWVNVGYWQLLLQQAYRPTKLE
jgi:L-amino acid N-acyltransferase YncA